MNWLAKLKSVLGLGNRGARRSDEYGDQTVSFERAPEQPSAGEPRTEHERAVKEPGSTGGREDTATTQETTATSPATDAGTDEPVQEIKGIGPAYAETLGEAGIETVTDLAAADAAAVAADTDISETRIQDWIDRARDR